MDINGSKIQPGFVGGYLRLGEIGLSNAQVLEAFGICLTHRLKVPGPESCKDRGTEWRPPAALKSFAARRMPLGTWVNPSGTW